MALGNYRRVLARPGVGTLLALMFAARIPECATSMVLTLYVVLSLHHGYGAAGLVGAAGTVGIAVGAPLTGLVTDRFGLRPMVAITTIGYGAYWLTAWLLPYPALLGLSFLGGVLALPVMSIGRQSLAALVPEEDRRAAYSLDSVSVELSFMVGPAMGVLVATKVSSTAAMIGLGGLLVLAGIALYLVNPPVRADHEIDRPGTVRPPRRDWLTPPLLAALLAGCGAVFALAGVEVAMVAALRGAGQLGWTGLVTVLICAASVAGGMVYGALRRGPGPLVLMVGLGLLTLPVGLAGGNWWMLALALVPCNLLCAPTLAATGDTISRLAPAAVRGEAMGLQSSALTLGAALGAPLVGTTVDRLGPIGGFGVAGLGALLVAMLAWPLTRRPQAPREWQSPLERRLPLTSE